MSGGGARAPTAPDDIEPIAEPSDDERRRRRVAWRVRLVVVGVIVTSCRWWFAADRRVFHLVPDEPGQLAIARWLGGGERWNMFDHVTYRPGYALVLAPIGAIADGGTELVRSVFLVNALIAGVSAVVLASLLARWTRGWSAITPTAVVVIAGITASAPAAISSSAYTWFESFITLTLLTAMWCAQRCADTGRLAVPAVAAAVLAMTVHGRLIPVLPIVVAICGVRLVADGRWRAALGAAGIGAVGAAVSLTFTRRVHDAVWDEPSDGNGSRQVVDQLDRPLDWLDALNGQGWYQIVGSLGAAMLGAIVIAWSLWRPVFGLDRRSALVIATLVGSQIGLSVVWLAGRDRADQLVHGRYVDAAAWPLVAIGLASVWRMLRDPGGSRRHDRIALAATAAASIVTGAVLALQHGDQLADEIGLRMMVPALLPYTGDAGAVPVVAITVIATLVILVVSSLTTGVSDRTARSRSAVVLVALLATSAWSATRVHDAQSLTLNRWDIGADVAVAESMLPAELPVGAIIDRDDSTTDSISVVRQRQRLHIYQLFMPDREFVWLRHDDVDVGFVFAPVETSAFASLGAELVWSDPGASMGLWEIAADDGGDSP